jgi:hypothetical protein
MHELLYVEDVACFLDVGEAAVRKRIRLEQLGPWMRSGRRWAIRKSTLLKWLDGQEGIGGRDGD